MFSAVAKRVYAHICLLGQTPKGLFRLMEWLLMLVLAIGMLVFAAQSLGVMSVMDWSESDTYFFFIRRILAIAIGVELLRFVYTNKLETLLEILIFFLARQLILMEINEHYEYLLQVIAGIALFVGMSIWIQRYKQEKNGKIL